MRYYTKSYSQWLCNSCILGLTLNSMRLTYPNIDRSDLQSVLRFYGQSDDPDDSPDFNDTATGPEQAAFDIDAFEVKLDGLRKLFYHQNLFKHGLN